MHNDPGIGEGMEPCLTEHAVEAFDWIDVARQLDVEGCALLPGVLQPAQVAECRNAIHGLRQVCAGSQGLGRGQLFYFDQQFPQWLRAFCADCYAHLAPIANRWNDILGASDRFPDELDAFQRRDSSAGRCRELSHLSRLAQDDFIALHQRADGDPVFPFQVVALLSEPEVDFEGGEFVMTEQRPRMQTRPMVLPLRAGDAAVISTARRPAKGASGYYGVNLKHAVSRIRSGVRWGLELTFHRA
jgi:hypothetical protein